MRLIAAGLLVVSGVLLSAQQPSVPRQQFETRAELVLVDVTVVDGDNRPVKDLQQGDFELQVNGQPRAIASAQYISNTPAAPSAPETLRSTQSSTNVAPSRAR